MIYIIGNQGNMGKRYQAVLEYLGEDVLGHDLSGEREEEKRAASGFIVATPTENHIDDIIGLFKYEKPILCEKPLTKSIKKLDLLEEKYAEDLSLLTMVNQYNYLKKGNGGKTIYDYFKSGKDGLAWDCINILGMARSQVELANDFPYWRCIINGVQLNLGSMDMAYIDMVKAWLANPESNYAYARKAHEKVVAYISENSF